MVYINLLPIEEIKEHAKAVQQLILLTGCFTCVLFLIGLVAFYQSTKISNLNKDIKVLKEQETQLKKILKQVSDLEKKKKSIQAQIAVIKDLKKKSALTVHILDEVANHTPTKRVWLQNLNQSGMSLNISGMALDNQTVANYMEELKKSPYIADVNLNSSSQKGYAGRNLTTFSFSCSLKLPQATQKTQKP